MPVRWTWPTFLAVPLSRRPVRSDAFADVSSHSVYSASKLERQARARTTASIHPVWPIACETQVQEPWRCVSYCCCMRTQSGPGRAYVLVSAYKEPSSSNALQRLSASTLYNLGSQISARLLVFCYTLYCTASLKGTSPDSDVICQDGLGRVCQAHPMEA